MIEYAFDGKLRATYLNVSQSSLIGSDNYHVSIVGGYADYTHP
jgi:hypothetical protein